MMCRVKLCMIYNPQDIGLIQAETVDLECYLRENEVCMKNRKKRKEERVSYQLVLEIRLCDIRFFLHRVQTKVETLNK